MNCLGIFAKHPEIGTVKTRLARETSPEWAAAVASAFLHDTVERLAEVPAKRVLAFAPASARAAFAELAGDRFLLEPQADGDLGRRLKVCIDDQLTAGCRSVVVVGTDSPTLPIHWITLAFDMLDKADVVLGPATDGGYYLLGCGSRLPPIFDGVDWGSPQVLDQTLDRLPDTWRVELLPLWYDVDTLAGWHMLAGHIRAMRRAGVNPRAPRTERLVRDGW